MDPLNKDATLKKVQRLAPMARVAFAGSCALRLLPTYLAIRGSETDESLRLKAALYSVWDAVLGNALEKAYYEQQLQIVMELIEAQPTSKSPIHEYEEDAAAAVAYALRALITESAEDPVWAAQRMYEAIARTIRATEDFSLKGPALAAELNKEPIMQLEFSRQCRDLNDLENWTSSSVARIIKQRAEAEPALPQVLPILGPKRRRN